MARNSPTIPPNPPKRNAKLPVRKVQMGIYFERQVPSRPHAARLHRSNQASARPQYARLPRYHRCACIGTQLRCACIHIVYTTPDALCVRITATTPHHTTTPHHYTVTVYAIVHTHHARTYTPRPCAPPYHPAHTYAVGMPIRTHYHIYLVVYTTSMRSAPRRKLVRLTYYHLIKRKVFT